MKKEKCKYYLRNKDDDSHIFSLGGELYCDNLKCKNQVGIPFSYESDDPLVAKCSSNGFIENNAPNNENRNRDYEPVGSLESKAN